ncbi:MAG: hydantoinase B/oxoprolinase family protein [Candidatus Bipolaricaulia bacterium]
MSVDPITLEVLRHALGGIAEEMLAALIRTGLSPNIRERHDCSTALFDADGQMVAQSESMPVHLGAMPFSVQAAIEAVDSVEPGDVVALNDPFHGGAHLPDLTLVTPLFDENDELKAFAANRAHHADVGGMRPGSVAGDATEIYQEGFRMPPIKLWAQGEANEEALALLLANVRTPREREGDLRAQYAANETARQRLASLVERFDWPTMVDAMRELNAYSERRMRAAIDQLPDGTYVADDVLDDDGHADLSLRASVTVDGDHLTVDFAGTAAQTDGPLNAPFAVTASAVYYTLRCLTDSTIPPNDGCYRPIAIRTPARSLVNAQPPAAVVGGNLETSQRIVDVLIKALAEVVPERAIAACQGTMNNFTFGGVHPDAGEPFTFYETIAGGVGAGARQDGADGMHSHMTNTLNTPIEVLETSYPVRVERYEIRHGSGGRGRHRGGHGLRRDVRALVPMTVSLLADRRRSRPYGLNGGEPGAAGEDQLSCNGDETPFPAKGSRQLQPGHVISIRTPGGGGYGPSEAEFDG